MQPQTQWDTTAAASEHAAASSARIERISATLARPDVSHAIFDFDGTLSWLRHGWPQLMLEGFLAHAPAEWRRNETIRDEILADILGLNGKPTIHQMNSFAERLEKQAGVKAAPDQLFVDYERHLHSAIRERRVQIERGAARESFVVHGAFAVLSALRDRGVTLIILSGSVESEVRDEAALLGLAPLFGPHIYGSSRGIAFSKKDVIERILREERVEGHHLLSFGDGPVEIAFTKAVGGLAIGVASDEDVNGSHRIDPFKREQLVRAGADAIVPDYAGHELLLKEIFGS